MKKSARDNSVQTIYLLENRELPRGQIFSDLDQVRAFVAFVTGSSMWRNRLCAPQSIQVYSLGDLKYSQAKHPNEIWLARRHWNQQVVLHELAHFWAKPEGHGPRFIGAYLTLMEWFMGEEYASRYREAFKREGIKCG